MIIQEIHKLFERDLIKFIKEIESYQNEESLWVINEGISNSGGNLALISRFKSLSKSLWSSWIIIFIDIFHKYKQKKAKRSVKNTWLFL